MLELLKNFRVAGYYRPGLVILWIMLALASRNFIPWFFWFTMVALPIYVVYKSERDYFRTPQFRKIVLICAAVLVAHVLWAIVRVDHYDASSPATYWRDDSNYYREARAIADAWHSGFYPDISLKGSPPYLGTLHTGYHRPLAAIFLLAGPSTFAGLVLNGLCAALLPLLTALAARYLWFAVPNTRKVPLGDFGIAAAALAAVHPNQFYWASYLLKDTFTAFTFMATLVLITGACRKKSIALAAASLLLLPYLFSVRAYSAISLVAGVACVPLLGLKRRHVIQAAAGGALFIFLFCAYTHAGNVLYRQLRDSFVALAPAGLDSPMTLIKQTLAGVPRLFLAPYAWLILEKPSPMYGMYPGMWYLYLIIYPLGFAGLHAFIRENHRLAVIPLAAFGLTALLFLSAIYAGNASRQRFYLEYVFILFAVYGLAHPNKWWIGGIWIAEAAFAIGQVIALK